MTEATDIRLSLFETLKQRRLERMRSGQTVCSIEKLISDPEFRVALVPLTEPQFLNSIEEGNKLEAESNAFEMFKREEIQRCVILRYACRNPDDLTEFLFESLDDILGKDSPIEGTDINHLFDCYLEMIGDISPALEQLSDDEFGELKKVWEKIEWNDLSGQQLYAAKRFISLIWPNLLRASAPGYFSTSQSTLTSLKETSASTATENATNDDVKSAEPL